ncbi:hypothetical protein OC834_001288 [Tilletia horrida]|nr:hypothetical protein OC834_001288 [Tilletia horrida]
MVLLPALCTWFAVWLAAVSCEQLRPRQPQHQSQHPLVARLSEGPAVKISEGNYLGYSQNVDEHSVDFFLGIRYAKPPTGRLRFAKPQALPASSDTVDATMLQASCLQDVLKGNFSEDCLFLNIMRPSRIPAGTKLPVIVYFYGGAFQYGTANQQNGSRIVAESVEQNAPVIFLSMNYRLGAFGFLGGSSVLSAARQGSAVLNAGMYDTRFALQWVQKNIAAFGGDPERVTIAGQSAGAFIVGNQLLAKGGNTQGLFQAAIMESGSPGSASILPPNHPRLDETFADISRSVGCPTRPSDLSCLKSIPASRLAAAANAVTESFAATPQQGLFPFMPVQDFQTDGFWFSAPPHDLVNQHAFSTVPIISGCNLDEGTSGAPKTLQDSAAFEDWFRTVAVINNSNATRVNTVLRRLFQLFPDDVTRGAPYFNPPNAVSAGTTDLTDPYFPPETNQFKRAAAIYGAWRYEAPHRKFLIERYNAKSSGVWSYRFAQQDSQVFGNTTDFPSAGFYEPLSKTIQHIFISFANYHDPRRIGDLLWPQFTSSGRQALQLKGEATRVISETFREASLSYMKSDDAATVLSS